MKLANKTALITGAAGGFGAAIAQAFADEGANLVLTDINVSQIQSLINSISQKGNQVIFVEANIADESQVNKMVNEALEHFKKIDILVNNAGIARDIPIQKLSVSDWNSTISINLTGTFLCSKAVIDQMIKNGYGKIINMSSISGQTGRPIGIDYATSKAGLLGFTRTLALELAPNGINVNAIAPGYIETDLARATMKTKPDLKEKVLNRTPLNRLGKPEEIAPAVVFLASDAANYITGATLNIDGGMTALGV